jgi:hypothetical protein
MLLYIIMFYHFYPRGYSTFQMANHVLQCIHQTYVPQKTYKNMTSYRTVETVRYRYSDLPVYLLKPSGNVRHHQASHSKIIHGEHIVVIYFVWISRETATSALNSIKRLVFITEVETVYSAVRTESLYKTNTLRL